MAVNVWISVQSDFGITMGELGKLSSDTDSALIGSTLMALKDIVTVEATSGESGFMTGNVESSSFGIFAVSINQESKVVMSYIISAEKGSTVKEGIISLVQAICNNFGRQLTQYGFIAELATSGAPIQRSALMQSFLNACTIVKLEKNLPNDKRLLKKGSQQLITELLEDKEQLLEAYDYILGPKWKTNEDLWTLGLLNNEARNTLLEGLAYHAVYSRANDTPLAFLYTPDPRSEHKRFLEILNAQLAHKNLDPIPQISSQLETLVENEMQKTIDEISSDRLHAIESTLFSNFIRKGLVNATQENPLFLLTNPDRHTLREKLVGLLPELEYDHAGKIIYKAIELKLTEHNKLYVETFYNSFIDGLGEMPIVQSAMDVIQAFSEKFIELKELKDHILKVEGIKKVRKMEIRKLMGNKEITKLNVQSIDEAVSITNAAGNALVNVLASIIIDQYLIDGNKTGKLLNKFINFYTQNGPIIKYSNVLVSYFNKLSELEYDVELITPTIRDLVLASVGENNLKIMYQEKQSNMKMADNHLIIDTGSQKIKIDDLLTEKNELTIKFSDKNIITIDLDNPNPAYLSHIINKPEVLINATMIAAKRRISHIVFHSISEWITGMKLEFDNFINYFSGQESVPVDKLAGYRVIMPPFDFSKVSLGIHIRDKLEDFHELTQEIWNKEIVNPWEKILDEAKKKGKPVKKIDKTIEKLTEKTLKEIEKSVKDLEKTYQNLVSEVEKNVKDIKSKVREILTPPYEEILKFDYSSPNLLPTKEEIITELQQIILKRDGIKPEDFERLNLNVSLTIFSTPPQSVYEPAYNEVISGKRSKMIKKVLSAVNSKKEFEQYLQEQGQNFASNIYTGISELINKLNRLYIDKDGIVTSDGGKIFLHIGRLPISKFTRYDLIERILGFSGISFKRETEDWLISFEIFELKGDSSEVPTIVTFEDAVRYFHRQEFSQNLDSLFKGLSKVAGLIETDVRKNLLSSLRQLEDVIYSY